MASGFEPELIDRSYPVHRRNDHVGRWRQPVHAAGCMILNDVPDASAIAVPTNRGVTAKLWLALCNTIPGRTQELAGGGHVGILKADTSMQRGGANQGWDASRSMQSSV